MREMQDVQEQIAEIFSIKSKLGPVYCASKVG